MYFTLEMLRAGSGDCFWIECGMNPQKASRIVIDGGNDDKVIVARLKDLRVKGQFIDLWIVTHTDEDHIQGVLNMALYGANVREVWFNAPPRWRETEHRLLSYPQGDKLAHVLRNLAGITKWNETVFRGDSVSVSSTANAGFPEWMLPNGIGSLKVVGPSGEAVEDLFRNWRTNTLGESDRVEQAPSKPALTHSKVQELANSRDKTGDRSVPNAASIMVLLELKGDETHRYLFPGDAPPSAVLTAIHKLKGTDERLRLDGFKLSHHASDHSISKALLESLDCRDFYISTNGKKHGLSNDGAIAKAIVWGRARNLFFNYEEVGSRWKQYAEETGDKLEVHLPRSDDDHTGLASIQSSPTQSDFWMEKVIREVLPAWTGLEISVAPAGDQLKVCFTEKAGAEVKSWPAGESKETIDKLINELRDLIERLADDWPQRDVFSSELVKVAGVGRKIYTALFGPSEFARTKLAEAPPKTEISFSSPQIAIPVPFLYSSWELPLDPKLFWAFRYAVSSPFEDPRRPPELIQLNLSSYIGVKSYEEFYATQFGTHHDDWAKFQVDWGTKNNCLSHFFCHNRNKHLTSKEGASPLSWGLISTMADQRKFDQKGPDLLFLNACDTHDLIEDDDWRRTLMSEPFYGFIGTEAAVNQTGAQEFALAFFLRLTQNADVHEAFDWARHQTWPAGLYYGIYLHPEISSAMFLAPAAIAASSYHA